MPTLTLRIKKRPDASAVLTLVRGDGSSTSGAIGPAQGYGPVHDLAHYVVERTLGIGDGFLGLVASGWEIRDFEKKGVAKQLPVGAILAESAAGELSRQAMMWQWSSADDYAWAVGTYMRQASPDFAMPEISDEMFEGMRLELLGLYRAPVSGSSRITGRPSATLLRRRPPSSYFSHWLLAT
jgi:hypothetical protein